MLITMATRMAYTASAYTFDDSPQTAAALIEQQTLANERLQIHNTTTPPKSAEVSAKYQHIVAILTTKEPTLDAHG